MTKVRKLKDELYQFIEEDMGVATVVATYDKNLAVGEMKRRNNKVALDNVKDEHIRKQFNEAFDYISHDRQATGDGLGKLKEYIKTVKKTSKRRIATGKVIFNEDKYNKKLADIDNQKQNLVAKVKDIAASAIMSNDEKAKALYDIRKKYDEINDVIILKDEPEFLEKEYIDIEITPTKAVKTVISLEERYKKAMRDVEQVYIDEQKRIETEALSPIDDDMFKTLKQIYDLVYNIGILGDRVFKLGSMSSEANNIQREAIRMCNSKEEYINRHRDIPFYNIKDETHAAENAYYKSLTDEEIHCVLCFNNLKHDFWKEQNDKRIKEEADTLVKAMS